MIDRRSAPGIIPPMAVGANRSVAALLDRLAPDQRAAATAPPGPVLCIAPAGSGKTTTLVARIAWLVDGGADPAGVTAIAFNKRAADELDGRLAATLEPLGRGGVRVSTFHALGREILREAGQPVKPLVDRASLLRRLWPSAPAAELRRLDTVISRLKLDMRAAAADVSADPEAGPRAQAYVAYEAAVADTGGLDFDDLIARSLALVERDADVRARWQARCAHLLVDEAQDLDRSQLDLALALAEPENRIFLVGDDDQSIYGWRLADVRRVLELADRQPGLQHVALTVNYRCPGPVVERAIRLVARNHERFPKVVRAARPTADRLILAPLPPEPAERARRILATWPADDAPRAVLARTNRELAPAVIAALEVGRPFRAKGVRLIVESGLVDELLDRLEGESPLNAPLLLRLGRLRAAVDAEGARSVSHDDDANDPEEPPADEVAAALLGWAAGHRTLDELRWAIEERRKAITALRRDDAPLSLATAHGTKGLEFDDVAVIDMDATAFPSARSLAEALEPERALEEERRLAYVAWTRARRSLLLAYDPAAPSPFLLEAFSAGELGLD